MSRRSFLFAAAGYSLSTGDGGLGPEPTTAFYGDNTVKLEIADAVSYKTDYTASFWFWLDPAGLDGYEYILFNIRGDGPNVDDISVNSTPFVWNLFCQRFGSSAVNEFSVASATRGSWQHVAMVKSGTTLALRIQQTQVASGTIDRSGSDPVPTNMRVGSWNGELGPMFGAIFDMKIWSAALSPAELATEASQLLPARTSDHWGTFILSSGADLAERNALRVPWVVTGTPSTITAPVLPWTA